MIVGTSRKRQNSAIKNVKREAKRQKMVADPSVRCTNCKGIGHKSSRSPDCPRHIPSKLEVMNQNLGTGFQSFTRKLPFDACVKERYRSVLKNRILSASEDVRQLLFRAQIFVNYYIILHSNENMPGCIYRQPFWYSICQLVNNKRVTNSNVIPPGMLDDWNNFRIQHPTILYKVNLASGNSQCLSKACLQVSITYLNAIVETFEQRVMSYLYYLIQNICMVSTNINFTYIIKPHTFDS